MKSCLNNCKCCEITEHVKNLGTLLFLGEVNYLGMPYLKKSLVEKCFAWEEQPCLGELLTVLDGSLLQSNYKQGLFSFLGESSCMFFSIPFHSFGSHFKSDL